MAYWSKRERSVQDGCEAFGSSEWRWSLHVTENQALCILLHVYKAFFFPFAFLIAFSSC